MSQQFAIAHLVWAGDGFLGLPGHLYFDCVESETLTSTSQVTSHPVESGANVADHVREDKDNVSLNVYVSNHPTHGKNLVRPVVVGSAVVFPPRGAVVPVPLDLPKFKRSLFGLSNLIGAATSALKNALFGPPAPPIAQVLKFLQPFNAVDETLTKLRWLKAQGKLLEVITRDWAVDSMVITSISEPRTNAQGSGANIQIEFQRIRIVETKLVRSPIPTEVRGKGVTNAGAQGSKDSNPAQTKSFLAAGSDMTGASKLLGI